MGAESPAASGMSPSGLASHTIGLTTTGFAVTELTPGGYVFSADTDVELEFGPSTMSVTTGLAARTAGAAMPAVNRKVRVRAYVDCPLDIGPDDGARYFSAKCLTGTGTLVVNGPFRHGALVT